MRAAGLNSGWLVLAVHLGPESYPSERSKEMGFVVPGVVMCI